MITHTNLLFIFLGILISGLIYLLSKQTSKAKKDFFGEQKWSPKFPSLVNDFIKIGNYVVPHNQVFIEKKDEKEKFILLISENGKEKHEISFTSKIERDNALEYYTKLTRYLKLKNIK